MKKLLYILVSCLLLTGCKTKQVTTDKIKVEQTENYDYSALLDYLSKNQTTKQLSESDVKAFMEAFSQLNVQYDGKSVEDKLNVLMQKTDQGTQITLSGIGKVNYTEENKKLFASMEKRLLKQQDSIASIQKDEMQSLRSDLFAEIAQKTKQVDTKTFTPAVWLIIGLAVIVGMCLNWVSKQFKPYLKVFKTT